METDDMVCHRGGHRVLSLVPLLLEHFVAGGPWILSELPKHSPRVGRQTSMLS